MKRGLVHIYTGNGKGKTTACAGLALRMAGSGGKVLYSFMQKGVRSSEIKVLETLENIEVFQVCTMKKFSFMLTDEERVEYNRQHGEGLIHITELCKNGGFDMVVVDELIGALHEKAIDRDKVMELINTKAEGCELVFSGREAPEFLIDAADYVSRLEKVKHPYEKNISARKGIEF